MKKNKRSSGFLGKLWNCVRFVFSKLNKGFDFVIYSNFGLGLITLAASIAICVAINYDTISSKVLNNSDISQEINNVSVDVLYDEDKYDISGVPSTVSVTLTGNATDIQVFRHQGDIKVQADLRKYDVGNNIIELSVENLPSNLHATIDPETISVDMEKKRKKNFSVSSEVLTSSKQKASDYTVTLDTNTVSVTGSTRDINAIRVVKAVIDAEDQADSFETDATLVAYDSKGMTVGVTFEPSTVHAKVEYKSSSDSNSNTNSSNDTNNEE